MAKHTVTASTEEFALFSRRDASDKYGNWTTASATPSLTFSAPIPKGAKNIVATLTVTVTQDPAYGSYFYVDGQQLRTSMGVKTISISVNAGTSSKAVAVTFTGYGTTGTLSQLSLKLNLSITYEYSASPLQRAENGALVKYRLYRAENGALVPYSVYRAESGQLVKY